MTDINHRIQDLEWQDSKEKFMEDYPMLKKLLNDLTCFCDNFYSEESNIAYKNYINDEITHEISKNKACSPTDTRDTNSIEEAFYPVLDEKRLDELRKQFFDLYKGEISDESLNWIYKVIAYIKNKY
jgi:hypothetical protein